MGEGEFEGGGEGRVDEGKGRMERACGRRCAVRNFVVGCVWWREANADVSSNLTFELEPGWAFVTTEDWRADTEGEWSGVGADDRTCHLRLCA